MIAPTTKPSTMSLKEWLIKRMAAEFSVSEKTLHNIVSHQFDNIALQMMEKDSLDVSGFGKFVFSKKRAERKLQKLYDIKEAYRKYQEDPLSSGLKKRNIADKLVHLEKSIELLKRKLDGKI